jgi:putative ABC transport system permease protein
MTGIAWRNLVRERTRLAVSVGGVAFAVLLILLQLGLYTGVNQQAARYLRSVRGDVWVGQAGTRGGFGHSVSVLPASAGAQLSRVGGVRQVAPLFGRPVVLRTGDGGEADVFLMGYDVAGGIGGPPRLVEGRAAPGPGEVIVDRVFARSEGLDLGDTVDIAGRPLRVSGIGAGGNSLITKYAWARLDDVAALVGSPGTVSYFVLRAAPGMSADRLARDTRTAVAGIVATTADEFVSQSTADIRESFLPILFVLVIIALLVGTAVIGLTIYTSVLEKRREYGVLKAIGFSNRRLLGIVWRQSLAAGMLGFLVGVPLTVVVSALIQRALPDFATALRPLDIVIAAGGAAVMSVLASFLPVRPVTRLDPAEVFRV